MDRGTTNQFNHPKKGINPNNIPNKQITPTMLDTIFIFILKLNFAYSIWFSEFPILRQIKTPTVTMNVVE